MTFIRQSLAAAAMLASLLFAAPASADDRNASPEKEKELIGVLKSEAPEADKAIACKLLAIHGSAAAVPELVKLLENERLCSWTRIALEAIPGPEASEGLRQGSKNLTGRLLVGTINSIGVRRDPEAVELLAARLQDSDADVGSAAAVALGRIGNGAAAKALKPLIATAPAGIRNAVAEGAVLCAEHHLADGKQDDAIALYDEVRKADVPRPRILEATRGAILARKPDAGLALLMEQLRHKELPLVHIGLSTAREFPGSAVDKALADELPKADPDRAPLLIVAMADRSQTVVLPAIVKAAGQGPKPVRLAAIAALGRVGNDTCVSQLLNAAIDTDADVANAAKASLSDLPGANVDKTIVSQLPKAQGALYLALIELIGQRRIEATADLTKALDNSDAAVRSAALASLGATVPQKSLSLLITQFISPKYADDAPVAKKALMTASVRMPNREACAEELSKALAKAGDAQGDLLEILAEVGGTKALDTMWKSAKSTDVELQDVSTKLLGKWMTIDAAPVLLDLTKSAPGDQFKVRALRGYIRIARQFVMEDDVRLDMSRKAIELSKNPAEQKLILDALKKVNSVESLKLALKLAQDSPEIKDDATQAALAIAQKLGDKSGEVLELLNKGGLGKVKLEIVKAEYGAGSNQKDVTQIIQKQAGDLQLISLPQANYNESFGGDPAPSTPKQLRIQYKINGQEGQATFAENALIILPLPKAAK